MTSLDPSLPDATPRPVQFTGERAALFPKLLRGFLLFIPTLGLYRFWLVTQKRQFYWANTEIDGDALEYTGTAKQLLVGFLIAVLIFVPLYAGLFFLSTQKQVVASIGYILVVIFFYLLAGYASYRARRFRLTRTLWRGIRFQQTGSPWRYALMNMGWSLICVVTLGLAYPFMAASLWRYQIDNTWYGDRQFAFAGSWRTVARPFYLAYFVCLAGLAALIGVAVSWAMTTSGNTDEIASAISGWVFLLAFVSYLAYLYVSARIISRMLSATKVGEVEISTHVRLRWLLAQHVAYATLFTIVAAVFIGVGVLAFTQMTGTDMAKFDAGADDVGQLMQIGVMNIAVLIGLYLAFLATWSILGELFLALGFWKLVANGTTITNAEDLRTVRAAGGESALAGEGLADALNVGAY